MMLTTDSAKEPPFVSVASITKLNNLDIETVSGDLPRKSKQ